MGEVIPFIPPHADPAGLLRVVRDRTGLSPAALAPLLGAAIGRPELFAGTVRAWEAGTFKPPARILEAACALARQRAPRSDDRPPRPFEDAA